MSQTTTKILYGAIFEVNLQCETENILLCKVASLKQYPFFRRSSIEEFCTFLCREMLRKTPRGVFHCIRDSEYHLDLSLAEAGFPPYIRSELHDYQIQVYTPTVTPYNNLSIVFITSLNYPSAPLLRLYKSILVEFKEKGKGFSLQHRIDECQNPRNIDKFAEIQDDIEEVKKIMVKNIDATLLRGEKIEDLLEKTNDVSAASKLFMKKSKKLNRWLCC